MFGKIIRGLTNGFLKIFGDIKVFKWPFFLIYDPSGYQVKGEDVREVINTVRPGDILVRGYKNYLDGYFIPGYFSHAGLYVGKVEEQDKKHLTSPKGKDFFRTGEQMVIHAMAEGVFMEDIINFCRCDHMAILRLPESIAQKTASFSDKLETGDFNPKELEVHNSLSKAGTIKFSAFWPTMFELALSQVGKPYDFQFNFSNYNNLSCTEFVSYTIKSLEHFHHLSPKKKRFLIFAKEVLTPDAYVASPLEFVWQSKSVKQKKIDKLKKS